MTAHHPVDCGAAAFKSYVAVAASSAGVASGVEVGTGSTTCGATLVPQ